MTRVPNLDLSSILVPIDFSEFSLAALEFARLFAEKAQSKVYLIHVIETYEYNVAIDLPIEIDIKQVIREGIEKKLSEVAEQYLKPFNIEYETIIAEGKIYKAIEKTVIDKGIGLVVMGTRGASVSFVEDPGRYVLGSNAYRVVRTAPCPVITLSKRKEPLQIKKIVLPLDVTKETTQKVGIAIQLAKLFNATIHAISVSSLWDEYLHDISRLKWLLDRVAEEIKREGIPVVTHMLRHDKVSKSVVEYADSADADLILIMVRQERKWNEMIIGSTARAVIENATVPVMSIKPVKPE